MESVNDRIQTVVLNLADSREITLPLPPYQAVVAAFELHDIGCRDLPENLEWGEHPHCREHRLGYSCGDWIAYKDSGVLELN